MQPVPGNPYQQKAVPSLIGAWLHCESYPEDSRRHPQLAIKPALFALWNCFLVGGRLL